MKKNRGFGKSHSWELCNSVFNFLKFQFYFVWCIWKKKNSENWKKKKKKTHEHMKKPLQMVKFVLTFKNQDLHDLFLETLFWINLYPVKNKFKLQIFGSLAF